MTEKKFISSIDGNFPYHDEQQALALIQRARSISDNAAFMVLHEIVRAPASISASACRKLYDAWLADYRHPLREAVQEAAEAHLSGTRLSEERAQQLLAQCSRWPGQYNALNIIYFAVDDPHGQIDEIYKQIIHDWQTTARPPKDEEDR